MFERLIARIIKSAERPLFAHPETVARYKFVYEYIEKNNNLILDIGCGEGYGLEFLSKKVRLLIGIDCCKEAVVTAKDKFIKEKNISFMVMDACALSFKNEVFDIICAFEILEHLEKPEDCLKEIKRVLKYNGKFILSIPNKIYWDKLSIISSPFHIKEYTYQEIKSELEDYFEIESFLGIFSKSKRIEEYPLFKIYMQIKRFLRLEKFTIRSISKIGRFLFRGLEIDNYYLSDKNLESCFDFLVICRK